jgi:hypothetical protein
MSYKVTDQRKQTMLKRIGEAVDLIDDQRFLPFYRSIQIKLEKMGKAEEWLNMIETAKEKAQPSHYFAKLCRMVKDGTYKFVDKVKEVAGDLALYLHDKLVKYNFGKYQKYWVRKAQEFINVNSEAGFVELLEYAERKNISQKYLAKALLNCKPPRQYYRHNILSNNQA